MSRQGSAGPVRVVLRDRAARRLAVAFTCFNGAEYASWLAMMIYAFDRGGAAEAGLVAVLILVPAGFLDPLAGVLAERRRADAVLAVGYAVQGIALASAAVATALAGPAWLVYGLLFVVTVATATSRTAQALVTPALARDAQQLTALNVVTEWSAQAAVFVAPAIAAVVFAYTGPALVFGVSAVGLLVGAAIVPRGVGAPIRAHGTLFAGALGEVGEGIRAAAGAPSVRIVLVLSGAGYVVIGALDVLTVALAIDHFGGSASGAAWLTASLGFGGVIGAGLAGLMVGRRLAPALIGGSALFGLALVLVVLASTQAVACLLFVAAGVGQAVVAIAGHTLLQRCAPTELVGRVFALREAMLSFGLAIGAGVAPLLIDGWSIDGAVLVMGAIVPAVLAFRFGALRRLDASATIPVVELATLRRMAHFAFLPAPALEGLAHNATWVDFAPGDELMRQGEVGDRFLAIAAGSVEVLRDDEVIGERHEGQGVGEIALLRTIPRTATVRALTAVRTLALGAEDFIVAVTGHDGTRRASEAIADHHLDAHESETPPDAAGGAVSSS